MTLRDRILHYAAQQYPVYREIALALHNRPEVCNQEVFACETLSRQLEKEGFTVTVGVAGHHTGFTACYRSGKPGPVICFLAEYDALPGLGHACGHNIFAATSCLAGAALKQVADDIGGEVRVYGTPGEEGGENGSAKGSFVREGFFRDVDAALCLHPHHLNYVTEKTLACAPVDIEFWGKPSHAAAAPEQGINALDALILTYNGINALRQHLTDDVRIHGIITDGGSAANIVPDHAQGRFYLRAASAVTLESVWQKVSKIVEGAALMTGARGEMRPSQNRVENVVPTPAFDAVYQEVMASLGVTVTEPPAEPPASTDAGNVSQVIPTIHPHISITDEPFPIHTLGFRAAACSERGLSAIELGAKGLALTAMTLILEPDRLEAIKAQHRQMVQAQ